MRTNGQWVGRLMPRTRFESALVAPDVYQGRSDAHHYDFNQQPSQDNECV
jgi:hypothetical protein